MKLLPIKGGKRESERRGERERERERAREGDVKVGIIMKLVLVRLT